MALGSDERYRLLASAVADRSLRVERTDEERCYTDGHTVYLAHDQSRHDDLAGLVVQGALLAEGSLVPEIAKRLVGRPAVARRYLAVEGWRALAAIADALPGLPIVAEARRIAPMSSSPEESMTVAIGRRAVSDPPAVFGVIKPRRLVAAAETNPPGGKPTPQDLARRHLGQQPFEEEDEDAESQAAGTIMKKLLQSPFQNQISQWLAKKAGSRSARGTGEGTGDLPLGGSRFGQVGANAEVSLLPARLVPNEVISEQGTGWRYPEWNVHAGSYRMDFTTVMEIDPRPDRLVTFQRPHPGDLRRRLARLGVGLERHRRQLQGDHVDLDAAIEARVELLAGCSPDEGLYVENQRRRRSLSVLLLLDVSGSVAERSRERRDVHQLQREAAAVLMDSLHALGDRVGLYGFRSQGPGAVYLIRVKRFEDALTTTVYDRLGGLAPSGYTRLGAAIRHGGHILATRAGTERRLLVVLSDGFAYDHGYEGTYGESDARKALLEARRQGVGCLCLSLGGTNDAESLRRVFGTAAHASAQNFEQLLPSIGPLFRRAMANADLHRRLAQRLSRSNDDTITRGVA